MIGFCILAITGIIYTSLNHPSNKIGWIISASFVLASTLFYFIYRLLSKKVDEELDSQLSSVQSQPESV